ncbi:unnamed protein product [Moneuplotes crassus]|uniref:Uncharacterized protein n=1 Tax=Euplotes crassus TaxID=5936 RepID=A0AAD1XD75_EUPCR|nr:unnamed protein product [Moneuplotes crassus]
MESMPKAAEEKDALKISLEKSVLEETKEQDIARCQSILYKIFPEKREIEPLDSDPEEVPENSKLYINSRNLKDAKLAQSFKCLKFFDTNFAGFYGVDSKNRHFCDFLESSFPDKISGLYFNSSNNMDLKRSNYLNSLVRISSKVLQEATFNSFCISLSSLKRMVAAYKHVRVLGLYYFKLSISSAPDFSKALSNCQIQELELYGSGYSDRSDWKHNFDKFKNLVQGLASSPDLRLSLKEVDITHCGINQDEVEQTFEENRLGGVKITGGK